MATKNEAKPEVPTKTETPDLLAPLSPEEMAEMLALTGQDTALRAEKLPQIKINYSDLKDESGRTIPKGNFVYGQSSATVEVEVADEDGELSNELRAVDLGVDLGKTPKITVLVAKQQYAYYNADPKQRCMSQVFGNGELPIGSNLKHNCRDKAACPRRKDGIVKDEKCSCQHVVICLVDISGEQKPAIMYIKGSSFMPFNDYLKAANIANNGKPMPVFMAPTKLKNSQEKDGSVTYYVTAFTLQTAEKYPDAVCLANFQQAKAANAQIESNKQQNVQKAAAKQLVSPTAGKGAIDVTKLPNDDDTICWD